MVRMDDRDCYEEPIIIVEVHGDYGYFDRRRFYCYSVANKFVEEQGAMGRACECLEEFSSF
jgi:hypothetical protein